MVARLSVDPLFLGCRSTTFPSVVYHEIIKPTTFPSSLRVLYWNSMKQPIDITFTKRKKENAISLHWLRAIVRFPLLGSPSQVEPWSQLEPYRHYSWIGCFSCFSNCSYAIVMSLSGLGSSSLAFFYSLGFFFLLFYGLHSRSIISCRTLLGRSLLLVGTSRRIVNYFFVFWVVGRCFFYWLVSPHSNSEVRN